MSCRTHYSADSRLKPGEDCEDCQKDFDSASSYCGNCWKIVSNKAFLAKKSPHVTGKCRERHVIPKSIFQRTVDKKMAYPYPEGFHAPLSQDVLIPYQWLRLDGSPLMEQSTGTETEEPETPSPYREELNRDLAIELLEEQNRLLRQLAAI